MSIKTFYGPGNVKYYISVLILLLLLVILVDLSNLDNDFHRKLCFKLNQNPTVLCNIYYDLPLWEVASSLGTALAAFIALAAIRQSVAQLKIEQTPHVVLRGVQSVGGSNSEEERIHQIRLENIGRGLAIHIRSTTDTRGNISIIQESNPHTTDLARDSQHIWAVDENQMKEGLADQGITINKSIMFELPKEETLNDSEVHKAEFNIYFWYDDQLGSHYKSICKVRRASHFIKVMETVVEKLS